MRLSSEIAVRKSETKKDQAIWYVLFISYEIQGLQVQYRIFDLPITGCANLIFSTPKAFFKSMQKHNSSGAIYKVIGWPGDQKNRKF